MAILNSTLYGASRVHYSIKKASVLFHPVMRTVPAELLLSPVVVKCGYRLKVWRGLGAFGMPNRTLGDTYPRVVKWRTKMTVEATIVH